MDHAAASAESGRTRLLDQINATQAELEKERATSDEYKQQLYECERQLEEAASDCYEHMQRAKLMEKEAKKVAKDAELAINAANGDSKVGQKSIAEIMLESAHSAVLLRMRQSLDEGTDDEVVKSLYEIGQHNLDLQMERERLREELATITQERDSLLEQNSTMTKKLEQQASETANLIAMLDVQNEPEGAITRRRKKRKVSQL